MFFLTGKLTPPIDICCNNFQISCNHRCEDLKHLYLVKNNAYSAWSIHYLLWQAL